MVVSNIISFPPIDQSDTYFIENAYSNSFDLWLKSSCDCCCWL